MKAVAASLAAASALLLGVAGFAGAQPRQPEVLEGKDRPILLARVVVTATALPDEGR